MPVNAVSPRLCLAERCLTPVQPLLPSLLLFIDLQPGAAELCLAQLGKRSQGRSEGEGEGAVMLLLCVAGSRRHSIAKAANLLHGVKVSYTTDRNQFDILTLITSVNEVRDSAPSVLTSAARRQLTSGRRWRGSAGVNSPGYFWDPLKVESVRG